MWKNTVLNDEMCREKNSRICRTWIGLARKQASDGGPEKAEERSKVTAKRKAYRMQIKVDGCGQP